MSSETTELRQRRSYIPLLVLARGGMGQVDLALREEGDFRRLYAVKHLHPHLRDDEHVREMFLVEARIAGMIRHSNVVSVLDVGEDEDGPFLVMDYIEGVSVSMAIKRQRQLGEALPLQLVLRIIAETARGLHAAHDLRDPDGTPRPVVHRDVSPQNILLGFDGVTRVTDFGVAKALGYLAQTDEGVLKGKMGYMSPEQLRFEPLDRRSDLFSLAVVLVELLTCRRLYGSSDETPAARRILEEPPPDLGEIRSDLPPELIALTFQLFAKDQAHRPSSAKEVADRLDAIRVVLEAEQGVSSLGDHLAESFADVWEKQKSAIAQALKSVDARSSAAELRGETNEQQTESLEPTLVDRLAEPKVAHSKLRPWVLLLALGLMSIVAISLWLGLAPVAGPVVEEQVREPIEPRPTPKAAVDPLLPSSPSPAPTPVQEEESEGDVEHTDESEEYAKRRRSNPRRSRRLSKARSPTPAPTKAVDESRRPPTKSGSSSADGLWPIDF